MIFQLPVAYSSEFNLHALNKSLKSICGNRGFYCRSYCLLNIFRAPLCPSSGAQEYYTVVAACGIWCCCFHVVVLMWSWGLCFRFAGCCSTKYHRQQSLYNTLELQHPANRTHNPQLHTRTTTCKPKRQVPQAATICINLELLMMGIMVPETCWADNKFCNKKTNLLHLVGLLFPRITCYVCKSILIFKILYETVRYQYL